MKTLSIFLVLTSLTIFTGCSESIVEYDYDTEVDFTNLNTYDWFANSEIPQENELAAKRIKNAVNRELAVKELTKVSENPDLLIAMYIGRQLKRDYFDSGHSYSKYSQYRTRNPIIPYEYEEGQLILDFVNAKSKELILRASAKAVIEPSLTPEQREQRINKIVSEILRNFNICGQTELFETNKRSSYCR